MKENQLFNIWYSPGLTDAQAIVFYEQYEANKEPLFTPDSGVWFIVFIGII